MAYLRTSVPCLRWLLSRAGANSAPCIDRPPPAMMLLQLLQLLQLLRLRSQLTALSAGAATSSHFVLVRCPCTLVSCASADPYCEDEVRDKRPSRWTSTVVTCCLTPTEPKASSHVSQPTSHLKLLRDWRAASAGNMPNRIRHSATPSLLEVGTYVASPEHDASASKHTG